MFEEQTVSSKVKGIAQKIKDAFLEGDFYDLGSALGEKIKNALTDIPWGDIQERFKENALSAATFINGIVDTDGLPEAIGETLANAFNTVTLKIKTFFQETKWKKVGKAVGDTLSTAVSKIDVQQLGEAVWSVLSAAVETALSMVQSSPIIGTAALIGIGLKYGGILGLNMGNGIAGSGLTSKISSLIPTTAKIAIVAAVGFKVGNYLYDNFDSVMSAADTVVEGWNRLWDTEAYHQQAMYWARMNGFVDTYYEKTRLAEQQKQFLENQGFTAQTAHNTVLMKEQLDFYNKEDEFLADLGIKTDHWYSKMKLVLGATEDEKNALYELMKKDWIVRFETKFGKTPQEMLQEWLTNLKEKFQPIADKLKEAGNDWGTAIKNGLLDMFKGDTIKNQIKKCLPTKIEVTAVANDSKQTIHAIKAYGNGGDPLTGSMFIAGERGAELVTSSSSGTSVYNRNQIAESVASGNAEQNDLLRQLVGLGQAILEKDTTISTDSISSALSRSNIRAGRTVVVTGG